MGTGYNAKTVIKICEDLADFGYLKRVLNGEEILEPDELSRDGTAFTTFQKLPPSYKLYKLNKKQEEFMFKDYEGEGITETKTVDPRAGKYWDPIFDKPDNKV
jgi:hypothetical protein